MRIRFLVTIAVLLLAASLFRVAGVEFNDAKGSSHGDFYPDGIDLENDSDNVVPTFREEVVPEIEESEKDKDSYELLYSTSGHQWLTADQQERLVLFEGAINETLPIVCCPAFYEMSAPVFARNLKGELVTLYRTEDVRQQFVEVSCKAEVVNQPCRFMHRFVHNRSKCVQKYSYSYALVRMADNQTTTPSSNATVVEEPSLRKADSLSSSSRDETSSSSPRSNRPKPIIPANFHTDKERYMLDHVRIRSGCNCEIDPKKPKAEVVLKKTKKVSKMRRKVKKMPES